MRLAHLLSTNTFVISLPRDKARLARLHASFDRYGVARPRLASAVDARDPRNKKKIEAIMQGHSTFEFATETACALSHVALLQYALQRNLDYIVVLEDDVVLCPFTEKLLQRRIPVDWDVLYLGHCRRGQPRNAASIVQPYVRNPIDGWYTFDDHHDCAFGMYAYAMRRPAIERLLASYTFHCPVDYHLMMNHQNFRTYGLYPGLVIHDYSFGSYSNPLRHENYSTMTSLVHLARPLASTGVVYMMFSSLHPSLVVMGLILVACSYLQARYDASRMTDAKNLHPNFPGIHGVDSYAPFCDALTEPESAEMMRQLRSLSWKEKRLFVWGHSLLGFVRDGKNIPWEQKAVVAHPEDVPVEKSRYIEWIPYREVDGHFLLPHHHIISFTPCMQNNIGLPPDAKYWAKKLYGDDCLDVVWSPCRVGKWRVPSEFRCHVRIKDLDQE